MEGAVLNETCILNNLRVFVAKSDRLKVRFQLFIKNPNTKFARNLLSNIRDTTYAHDPQLWLHLVYSTRNTFVQGPPLKRKKVQDYFAIVILLFRF
jgi:hypothetical protein